MMWAIRKAPYSTEPFFPSICPYSPFIHYIRPIYIHFYLIQRARDHRRSQGVQWVHLHPLGGEKIFSGLIYRKNV